ncbi:PEPxxWA-CTERM sorting domain-containing protein [Phenylobacterium kunshanense]|uniref:PEP-CTERM protein-sorting domain-containing protein n=1 Tax=Phenylobacterium kunshanense TaxID=1445034 RepID=A0A328BCU8_9CAUL|nr:PEPxxWA-CTERM sorting domain-containing protein [Phenylobacterium kunshanense]RAK64807.1 hypothetical protein DJ019_12335 [Phenylobacterium kunshanense]
MKKIQASVVGAAMSIAATQAFAATVVHETDFAGDISSFTMTGFWSIGPAWPSDIPQAPAIGNPDPTEDHTPTDDNMLAGVGNGLGYLVYVQGAEPGYLTSGVIDLSGYSDVTFSFWRFLNTDYLPYIRDTVEVFDGAVWRGLVDMNVPGEQPRDSEWTLQSFDVSAYANADFRYRFGYEVLSPAAYVVTSWNVDDVVIEGVRAVPEPGVWALMILGFAAAGAMLRRAGRAVCA